MRLDWANSIKCASRVKHWAWDVGNINLPVRYKTDKCRCCGLDIDSSHFIKDCPLGRYLFRFGKKPLYNHFIVWRIHACKYENHENIYKTIKFTSIWLLDKIWLKGLSDCVIKWLINQKRLYCLPNSNLWRVKWKEEK